MAPRDDFGGIWVPSWRYLCPFGMYLGPLGRFLGPLLEVSGRLRKVFGSWLASLLLAIQAVAVSRSAAIGLSGRARWREGRRQVDINI